MKFREGFGKGQSATIGRIDGSTDHANYIGKGLNWDHSFAMASHF
jgi:hypothetical protein